MPVGVLRLHIGFHGNRSLKEKRGQLLPLISKLRKQFNLSIVEMDMQDRWNESIIACAGISNSSDFLHKEFQNLIGYLNKHYPAIDLYTENMEFF
ncbi:MAG: DUF503 domain-containing protein [Anaerolineae bacterium]|jgi:hypothetical protein|nr:DUF503 domain-containing protein [Anaerolineae bacterium]